MYNRNNYYIFNVPKTTPAENTSVAKYMPEKAQTQPKPNPAQKSPGPTKTQAQLKKIRAQKVRRKNPTRPMQ